MRVKDIDYKHLKCLVNGDKKALSFLYQKYYAQVYHFASLYVDNEDDVTDIVQDIYLKIWLNREKVDPKKDFSNYLFIVTRNHIFNLKRQINNKFTFIVALDVLDESIESADQDLEAQELKIIIDETIKSLPDRQKEVFLLSRKHSLTNKEISSKLQISVKTVENHMTKALSALREVINQLI